MEGSRRYNVQYYQQLIDNYLCFGSTELSDLVLTGDDLLDFVEGLENVRNDYRVAKKETEGIKKLSKDLIKKVETLFRGKKGSFVDELRMHLDFAKEKLEEE